MKIAWDRTSHNWDTEMILRTMMLGDMDEYRQLLREVPKERIKALYRAHHAKLDTKSQIFWGHLLSLHPRKKSFTHSFHGTPSRHITKVTT